MSRLFNKVKKGQTSGTGAAVLVLIIAALIIIYILILPGEQRQELLEEGNGTYLGGVKNKTLLLESPGRLDYIAENEIVHTVPSINLYSTTQASILKSIRSVYVKNAWLDKQSTNFSFSVDDIENTKNVMMTFNVKRHQGRLVVKLNGFTLFNKEIRSLNIPPIAFPEEYISDKNVVEISVSSVGARFWSTNEYELENLKITADYTDISTQESKNVFQVSATERENLDRVWVKFFPHCVPEEVGILNIYLNNHNIFSSVPDCGILRPIEISSHFLISGENVLIFQTTKGAYLIDTISIKSKLKELTYPTFYFEINQNAYNSLLAGAAGAWLRIEFADDTELKKADLFINGHLDGFTTRDRIFEMRLDPFVNKGNNVIEIKPRTTLDIVNLEVLLD